MLFPHILLFGALTLLVEQQEGHLACKLKVLLEQLLGTKTESSSSGILVFQQQVNDSRHLAGGSRRRRTAATVARHP